MPNASSGRSVRPPDGTFPYCNYHRGYLLCARAAADFPRLHPRLNRRNNRAAQRFACAFPQHAVPVTGIYCRIEERAFPGNNSSPFHKTRGALKSPIIISLIRRLCAYDCPGPAVPNAALRVCRCNFRQVSGLNFELDEESSAPAPHVAPIFARILRCL